MSRKRDILPILSKKKATLLIESYVDQMDSKYDISGPKSSVFRKVPCSEATEITNRLSVPRASADEIRNMVIDRKKREMYEKMNKHKYSNEVKKGQNVNHMYKGETSFTDQRIHVKKVNRPTVSSYVRLQLFRNGSSVSEITNACERSVLQPSQRYFPMAYIHWWKVKNLRGVGSDFRVDRKSRNLWFEQYTA
jgi:hypothetical protein